ncbi:unnamed protein product [Spirodela intermedia]|uniref:DUF6817 domain-containing protein n=1 Tax=Spirodela intermedia TaxID=51605 RepID=A0A7I8J8S2_SPIIN|nr:unnamed protein product [Spirodela intermedia]CAA6666606.1 unnamed protein product [Spirodela intermedia]
MPPPPSCYGGAESAPSSSNQHRQKRELPAILELARPFLRGSWRRVGAGECWHKHGSFLDHLVEVYRILKIWLAPDVVARCGLYHSAYSNSYVNLAIFDPATSRDHVRDLIGGPAERFVHLFCIVPRQSLIHDDLLFRYADAELTEHLELSEASVVNAMEKGIFDPEEPWRKKHIKTGEDVPISRRMVAAFLLMTMADFSDQLFGFQDALFDNADGRLAFSGNNYTALWPGNGKPGMWMNSISRMGALYSLIVREEEIYLEEQKKKRPSEDLLPERDEEIELVIPPVFESCTKVLDVEDQSAARDLYWAAVCGVAGDEAEEPPLPRAERLLLACVEKNPFVGEPRLVLAQVYLGQERFPEAEAAAAVGLRLMLEWGSCWDKRMSWEGWIAWGRVLLMKAQERSWPRSSWGILNLGLVN